MRIHAVLLVALAGCQPAANVSTAEFKVLTYQELVDYPIGCELKVRQLAELKNLQVVKKFNSDPDLLSPEERTFNARLKATIWWYAYRCEES